jgi:hypothetical protein
MQEDPSMLNENRWHALGYDIGIDNDVNHTAVIVYANNRDEAYKVCDAAMRSREEMRKAKK